MDDLVSDTNADWLRGIIGAWANKAIDAEYAAAPGVNTGSAGAYGMGSNGQYYTRGLPATSMPIAGNGLLLIGAGVLAIGLILAVVKG